MLGVMLTTSEPVLTGRVSSSSPLNAASEMPTSCVLCSRRFAVTMTSSSPPVAGLAASAVPGVEDCANAAPGSSVAATITPDRGYAFMELALAAVDG